LNASNFGRKNLAFFAFCAQLFAYRSVFVGNFVDLKMFLKILSFGCYFLQNTRNSWSHFECFWFKHCFNYSNFIYIWDFKSTKPLNFVHGDLKPSFLLVQNQKFSFSNDFWSSCTFLFNQSFEFQ
jgi:hypothetical protein